MTRRHTLIAHPTEIRAAVAVEGLTAAGALETVHLERWATDLLDVEVWAIAVPHPAIPNKVRRSFFTNHAIAATAACRHYAPAGGGLPPFTPDQLLRRSMFPTGSTFADGICLNDQHHTH